MGKAKNKSRITSTCSKDVFAAVYSTVIRRIYTSLYSVKLNTKLAKAFSCRQCQICKDDVDETKCLPFRQVKILPLRAFKEQLHISAKLVKDRVLPAINIIMCLSLTG